MMADRDIVDPTPDPDSQPFWDACRASRFMLKTCGACHRAHWYPRPFCPMCGSLDVEWVEASGRGTVYSYAYMLRAKVPYMAAYVTLAEGPRMLTNVVDCEPGAVAIDMPVEVTFKTSVGGFAVPMFRPAGDLRDAAP